MEPMLEPLLIMGFNLRTPIPDFYSFVSRTCTGNLHVLQLDRRPLVGLNSKFSYIYIGDRYVSSFDILLYNYMPWSMAIVQKYSVIFTSDILIAGYDTIVCAILNSILMIHYTTDLYIFCVHTNEHNAMVINEKLLN